MTLPSVKELNEISSEISETVENEALYNKYMKELEDELIDAVRSNRRGISIDYRTQGWLHEEYDELKLFNSKEYLNIHYSNKVFDMLIAKGYTVTRVAPAPFICHKSFYNVDM